jgi:hypothetical protein
MHLGSNLRHLHILSYFFRFSSLYFSKIVRLFIHNTVPAVNSFFYFF